MAQFDQDFYAGKIYDVDTNEEPSVDSNIPEMPQQIIQQIIRLISMDSHIQ